jgi:hypothetical protein
MAGWSPLGELQEPGAEEGDPTWGDYGSVIGGAGVQQVTGMYNAAGRFLAERAGNREMEDYYKAGSRLNELDSDETMEGLSEPARRRLTATISSEEFWKHPVSATALKASKQVPTLAASVVPAMLMPGAVAAGIGAGVIGGGMTAAQSLDEFYKLVDNAPEETLMENQHYAGLRSMGMSEEDARREYGALIRENKPLLLFALGAFTNAMGPAGQLARVAKGGAGALSASGRGVAARVGAAGTEGAVSEAIEEGAQDIAVQSSAVKGGLKDEIDWRQTADAAGEGALLGAVMGGPTGLARGRGAQPAQAPVEDNIEIVDSIAPTQEQQLALQANEGATPTAPPEAPLARPTAPPEEGLTDAPTPQAATDVPPEVVAAPKRVRRKRAPVTEAVAPTPEAAPEVVTPEVTAPVEAPIVDAPVVEEVPTGPRVLPSLAPQSLEVERQAKAAQDAAAPRLPENQPPPDDASHDLKRDVKRVESDEKARAIFEKHAPETPTVPADDAGRTALLARLDATLKEAEAAGISIPKRVGQEDYLMYLREVKDVADILRRKATKQEHRVKRDERVTSFLMREKVARGGDFSVMRSERLAEGDLAKARTGGTATVERAAAPVAAPETPTAEVGAQTTEETAPSSGENEGVRAEAQDMPASAVKSRRGARINVPTETATVKAGGKTVKVERAVAASKAKKIEITPELRAKYETPGSRHVQRLDDKYAVYDGKGKRLGVYDTEADARESFKVPAAPPGITPKVAEVKKRVEEAAKRVNTKPTEAQKESGTYAKGHVAVQGLNITIENPKGSERTGKTPNGNTWSVKMPAHYGYVKRTEGADGDQVDVYIGDKPDSQHVFIIDQKDLATGEFDEHKVMLGFDDPTVVFYAYDKSFSDGRGVERIGKITPMTMPQFKEWLAEGDTKKAVAEESNIDAGPALPGTPGIEPLSSTTAQDSLASLQLDSLKGIPRTMAAFIRNRLLERVGAIPVHVLPDAEVARMFNRDPLKGENIPSGYWDGDNNLIAITASTLSDPAKTTHIVLHEATHAATSRIIKENEGARKLVSLLMDETATRMGWGDTYNKVAYAFTNEREFIAEAFSNPTFQNALARIEVSPETAAALGLDSQRTWSVWTALVDSVRKWLGLPPGSFTMLEATIRVGEELVNAQQKLPPKKLASRLDPGPALADIQRSTQELFTRAEKQEQVGSPRLLKIRTMDQLAQAAANYFPGNNPVRTIVDTIERIRSTGQKILAQSEPITMKLYQLERKYRGAQWERFTTLVHDETMTGVDASKTLDENSLDTDAMTKQWAKQHHADLSSRYTALPDDLKQARREAMEYFRNTQNKMSLGIIRNRVLRALGVNDDALAVRIHEGNTTDADAAAVGGQRVMDLIKAAKELGKITGPYFPLMRRGNFVVRGTYKIAPPAKALRQIDENTWEFADKDDAIAFGNAQATRPDIKTVYVDPTTGERFGVEADGTEVRLTDKDPDADQRWRVSVQDKHVEFFETKSEALEAAADLEKSGEFASVAGVEERRFEPGDRQSDMLSSQLKHLMAAVENRKNFKDMSKSARDDLAQALNEVSIRFLGSTRIQSRRLPRRYVEGASKDLTRNTLEYSQSSSSYLAKLEHAPTLETAMKEMEDAVRNDAAKSTSMGRRAIANEIESRVADRSGFAEDTKTNRVFQRILTASFLDKLFSASYSVINAMQPAMVTMPVLSGRHGAGRAFAELSRAYNDVAAWSVVKQGVNETYKKLRNEYRTTNYLEDVKARLRNPRERAMLDYLSERGSIDPDAGLEIAALIKSHKGAGGRIDAGLGYLEGIARQMPRAIETINRTTTALAAYRLEFAKTNNHDKAVAYAQTTVNNTQGLYSNTNAPPVFNHPLFKLSLQFKKYPQMMYHLLGQEIGKAFYGKSREEKIEGMKTLAYIAGTHAAMAGALGLPTEPFKYLLMGAKIAGLSAVGWDDVEEWGREKISGAVGAQAGEAIAKGLPRLIGVDLSSRVGLDSLLTFGEPKTDKKNDIKAYLLDLAAGAPGSLIGDWISGINALGTGNLMKGAELLTPLKFAGDSIKAYRLATEGKKSESGRQLSEPYSFGEAAVRAIGFTPAREAEGAAQNAAFQSQSRKATGKRQEFINAWVNAKGPDKVKVQREIQVYNKTAPKELRIEQKDLTGAAKRRASQGTGSVTNKRTKPTLDRLEQVYNTGL